MRRSLGCFAVLQTAVLLTTTVGSASPADLAPPPRAVVPPTPKMPLTGLAAAKPMFDACVYRYGVGTANKECQAFVDQALGMYYSYVWMEAARAAETALTHDPECAYAWLMLHRVAREVGPRRRDAQDRTASRASSARRASPRCRTGSPSRRIDASLEMARKLMPKASHREQLLIQSRLQEKGMWPNVKAGRAAEEGAAIARRTAHALRRRRGRLVLAGATRRRRRTRRRSSTRRSCGSTRSTPARTTNSSTSSRTSAGRRSAGRSRKGTSSRRPASRTPSTCRPTSACASASGARRPTGAGRRSNSRSRTTSTRA